MKSKKKKEKKPTAGDLRFLKSCPTCNADIMERYSIWDTWLLEDHTIVDCVSTLASRISILEDRDDYV